MSSVSQLSHSEESLSLVVVLELPSPQHDVQDSVDGTLGVILIWREKVDLS